MSLFKSTLIATALVAAGVAGTASAADLTDNFEVRITIEETCNVLTASDIDFGSTIPTAGGQVDRTGTINVNCTSFRHGGDCLHQAAPRRWFGPARCIVWLDEMGTTSDPRQVRVKCALCTKRE